MIDNKLVAFFKEGNPNGCNFYRIKQPAMKMAERGHIMCTPSSELTTLEEKDIWVDQADIIVTQQTSEAFLEFMHDQKGKKRFVIDWDDNLYDVSPYNPAYKDHGYREVRATIKGQPKMLWEDGKGGFNIVANKKRLAVFSECLSMANLVTTPSPILSGMFKKLNPNVKVIKNLLNFDVWSPLNLGKDDKIRIGWQGGWSHYEDWCLVQDSLREILRSNPRVMLYIMGTRFDGPLQDFPLSQVQIEGWLSIEAYPYKFKTLNLDIGIAPLENTAFSTCKSELKWTEYSALGIPCVCSNIPPYSLNVDHGETGYLCSTKDEWIETLQTLIDDVTLRKAIGEQARKYVFENYNLDSGIEKYEDAYQVMCNMKKELILN